MNVTAVQSVIDPIPANIVTPPCSMTTGSVTYCPLGDNLAGVSYDFRWHCAETIVIQTGSIH